MSDPKPVELEHLAELHWSEGRSAFHGSLSALYQALDHVFVSLTHEDEAVEYMFPPVIAARHLDKIDYFSSFPHLVGLLATLTRDEAQLDSFASRAALNKSGEILAPPLAPVRELLAPATCYHFYPLFQGNHLGRPLFLTASCRCFRHEAELRPLERQTSFTMREIVVIGNASCVKSFLARYQARLEACARALALPVKLEPATDPFFRPSRNPKYLMQKLEPSKTEVLYKGRLAISSINFHRNYFGDAFHIIYDNEDAFSGCIAFGIERWMLAVLDTHGTKRQDWPDVLQTAMTARSNGGRTTCLIGY